MDESGEPPLTYEHVIGQQQLEIIMLTRSLRAAEQRIAMLETAADVHSSERTNGAAQRKKTAKAEKTAT